MQITIFLCINSINPSSNESQQRAFPVSTAHADYDDVIKWKHFPRYWPFVRGTTHQRWIPLTKVNDAELSYFLWANDRDADDLRPSRSLWRHCNDIWDILGVVPFTDTLPVHLASRKFLYHKLQPITPTDFTTTTDYPNRFYNDQFLNSTYRCK